MQKKHSTIGVIGFVLSIIQMVGGYIGLSVCVVSFVLCIIGCVQKDKKHIFPIIGNVISFVFLIVYIYWLYLASIHYVL